MFYIDFDYVLGKTICFFKGFSHLGEEGRGGGREGAPSFKECERRRPDPVPASDPTGGGVAVDGDGGEGVKT